MFLKDHVSYLSLFVFSLAGKWMEAFNFPHTLKITLLLYYFSHNHVN